MLKNTPSGNRLGALLLVWYVAIWFHASTHANQISLALYHFWKNLCGIYNFYVFVYWDQDTNNLFSLALQAMWRNNFRACSGLPFITSSASGPCRCCFHTMPTIVVFSTWDLPLALEHGEVAVIYDNVNLIVIRLLKEILQQPTASNYLTQLTNKPIRLLNISLAPGSQEKINQLLPHRCLTAFIVTKETLQKLLTTFLKKH